MNKLVALFFIPTFVLCGTKQIWADEVNYWQCAANDNQSKQWIVRSAYERVAMTRAFDACKKQSATPISCKFDKESCEYFANGISTRPMWQCTALDQMAKPWMSDIYNTRDKAAIQSKEYCQQHSGMPESCYINLMTCKNLNERF